MDNVTLEELEQRWQNALSETEAAVIRHPCAYRQIRTLADHILKRPLDISEYLPTTEKLTALLRTMDPDLRGSIFAYFINRISPSSIWHIQWLRVECGDLLDHLNAFDDWRRGRQRLKRIK